ncbi:lytic transglycosylase domain-containing protein [uncultured Brevundimonas sp.]|uniref:lytic transglycosylase domain-containing protein n=1 Tax=uncultured Brevundimonas sp. TaxID=213418 RepID=UPI002591BA1D|nr:lytic transglycosylase domain-containing protein [uncultured Brevundimonas sp.]
MKSLQSTGRRRRIVLTACLGLLLPAPFAVQAAPSEAPQIVREGQDELRIEVLIAQAARRFGVPEDWIRAVMRQESGFDPTATSRAGAMGLMQVMPNTWAELRLRHGLGADPYDPQDNVLAGTAYLREMYDRFGLYGMLAAYNAGPGRYLQHREDGRPLPAETRDYIARISARIGRRFEPPSLQTPVRRPSDPRPDPAAASLFPTDLSDADRPAVDPLEGNSLIEGLFVRLSAPAPDEGGERE